VRRRPGQALLGIACLALFLLAGKLLWPHVRALYHARAAQKAIERWDFDEAGKHLDICLSVWKDSASTRFLAARTARRAGRLDEAEEHLRRYQREQGSSNQTALEWGLLRAQRGEVADVEAQLRASVGPDDPDAPLVLEALARGYLMTDRMNDLLQATDLWLQVRPHDTHALYWRGLAWDRLGNGPEALAAYRDAVEADPENMEARLHLGEVLLVQARNPEEALGHFEHVRVRKPSDANAAFGVARCQVLLGQTDAAREQLDALLAEHPDYARALVERGKLALAAGDAAGAEASLRRAFALTPDDRVALHNLIEALRKLDKTEDANRLEPQLKELDTDLHRLREIILAVAKDPHDLALRTEAAEICLRHGRKDEGRRWLATVLRRDPSDARARAALAAAGGPAASPPEGQP